MKGHNRYKTCLVSFRLFLKVKFRARSTERKREIMGVSVREIERERDREGERD